MHVKERKQQTNITVFFFLDETTVNPLSETWHEIMDIGWSKGEKALSVFIASLEAEENKARKRPFSCRKIRAWNVWIGGKE